MKNRIILASASPRRSELLAQVGITPEIQPSQIEEIITSKDPEEVVQQLSRQKAMDVAGRCEGEAYVIGADTVVAAAGDILGKPRTVEEAAWMIRMLQGKVHQVFTGVTIVHCDGAGVPAQTVTFAEKTDVWVYDMEDTEIRSYAESGDPMDKAGAYGIQGQFAAYVKGICGDYNNVVGLPVGRVCQEIKRLERMALEHD